MNFFATNTFDLSQWNRYEYISVRGVLAMLSLVAFFLIINKIDNKQPLKFPVHENLDLEQYTFGFEDTQVHVKKISLPRRIAVYLIAAILIITPLNELIRGLGL
jgi:hypothetical protein